MKTGRAQCRCLRYRKARCDPLCTSSGRDDAPRCGPSDSCRTHLTNGQDVLRRTRGGASSPSLPRTSAKAGRPIRQRLGRCLGHTYNVLAMPQLHRLTRPARYGVQLAGAAWPQFLRPLVLELASHRPIREVLPGVYHWTAIHPKIRLPVDSYYIEPARVVLDPMVPREGLEWFRGARPRARLSSPTATISATASAMRRRSAARSVAARPACTSSSVARRSRASRSVRSWPPDHRAPAGSDLPGRHRAAHLHRRQRRAGVRRRPHAPARRRAYVRTRVPDGR